MAWHHILQCLVNGVLECGSGVLQSERKLDILTRLQWCHHQCQWVALRGQRNVVVCLHEILCQEKFGPPHHLENLHWSWNIELRQNDEFVEARQISRDLDHSIRFGWRHERMCPIALVDQFPDTLLVE